MQSLRPDWKELEAWALGVAPQVEAAQGEDAQAGESLRLLASEGILAHAVPADFGGARIDGVDGKRVGVQNLCAIRERLAFASGMLDVMFVEQGLGSYPVALGSRGDWAHEVFSGVAKGVRVAAFALTETGAGSDVSGVATRAKKDGEDWVLDGAKTLITNAGIADFYTVLARSQGQPGDREGLTMFYVPAESPGVSVERFEVMAPHPIGDVRLEKVRVPDGHRLGEEGQGMELALANLAQFRTSVAAAACGFSRRALFESIRHLDRREQFGRALSSFQGLRFDLAEMDVRLSAGRLLVSEAARLVDSSSEDATRAVARAKLFATESASWICDRAVQHLGGLGVRRGQIVERLFREVRALRIYEGTSEVQKLILAKAAISAHREGAKNG